MRRATATRDARGSSHVEVAQLGQLATQRGTKITMREGEQRFASLAERPAMEPHGAALDDDPVDMAPGSWSRA